MIQIAVLLKRLKTFGAINICLPVAVQQRLVQVTKLSFVIGNQGIQSLINAPRMALAVTKRMPSAGRRLIHVEEGNQPR